MEKPALILCFFLIGFLKLLSQNSECDKLLNEAFERSKYDIRASHIFVKLDSGASPLDTLAALSKINRFRNLVMNGESFEMVAVNWSEDPSARDRQATKQSAFKKGNKGDLGYFTVFDMIYPFESVAYSTKTGEISPPFRTKYGYHILKVTSKTAALGKVQVAQIILKVPQNATAEDSSMIKAKAESVYRKLKNGESWNELVLRYSDDKGSAQKGGELPKFGVNRMMPEFVDAVKSIKNVGDFSAPVMTSYGWHIVKLLSWETPKTLEEEKPGLEKKLLKDDRWKSCKANQEHAGNAGKIKSGKTGFSIPAKGDVVVEGTRFEISRIAVLLSDTIELPRGFSYSGPGNPAKEKKEIYKAEAGYQYCKLLIDIKNLQNKYNISSGDMKMVTGTESYPSISFGLLDEGENGYVFKVFPVGATFFCDPDKSNTYCFVFLIPKNKDIKEYKILFKDVKIS